VVTVTSGDYTDITDVWIARDKVPPNGNGLLGNFGVINLQTVRGKPKSGEGNFQMCIVKEGTNDPVTLEQFSWSIYDVDSRHYDEGNRITVKERLIMDVGEAQVYQLAEDTEVQLSCEDGSTAPCPGGIRTIFNSSTRGGASDNPLDPNDLTDQQKRRSVSFTFANTSCWQFTYDHYCPVEQPEYTGNVQRCRQGYYSGGNFMFYGKAEEIIEEGECLTPSPTLSPSIPPPPCPEDVTIIHMDGITTVDAGEAVRILEQDTTSVTVRLYQGWTSASSTENVVDRIYYNYKPSTFNQKCHVAEDVAGLVAYDDITIQCYQSKALAELDICVADNGGALDPEGDDAEISKCCNPDVIDGTPVVCYKFVISCDSVCADDVVVA
jgi:hypothetical protein